MVQAFNSLLEKWFFFKVYIVDYLDFLIFLGGGGGLGVGVGLVITRLMNLLHKIVL